MIATPLGARYEDAIDLGAIQRLHRPRYESRQTITVDGNTAAAIPFLQWWRCLTVAGFPITPSTKWLEHLAAELASGRYDVETPRGKARAKRLKLLEAEHAVADYLVGTAASCRQLITGTASSSVGLDHMTETLRSLGASGLGNVLVVDVCRATANFPLCIEGDSSDLLAHRDDGFVQVVCRGRQQIYDTLLQLPTITMHPDVLTPGMIGFYGIKDSHRTGKLVVEPDDEVNAFLDTQLAQATMRTPPGLLDGDTALGSCVTSASFQGFKITQKQRFERVLGVLPGVASAFQERFGRPGLEPFERIGMEDQPEIVLVAMGPDAGTAVELLPRLREELAVRVGLVVMRLLSPFPAEALGSALRGASAVGVVNNAHHGGRGHLTLDVMSALGGRAIPVESFFCGLGGADVSRESWRAIARTTREAAERGQAARPWHAIHDGAAMELEA
jgi:pyruvate ferredoxin oxidoreductase alpha subunit